MQPRTFALVTAFAVTGLSSAAASIAPASAHAATAPAAHLDLGAAQEGLKTSDPSKIDAALTVARVAGKDGGGRKLTAAIVDRLKMGLPVPLAKKALETLADLEDGAATEGCELLLGHREPELRVAATRCLGGAKTPAANKALRRALDDQDPRVRSMAASMLGASKVTEALPDLVTALDKGLIAAAASIGMLCDGHACDALLDRLKSKPFDVISSGMQQVLARRDVGEEVKLDFVQAVRALESQKAREFLVEVRASWPAGATGSASGGKRVVEALDRAIKELEGASK